jgi:hypothetical protein
LPCSKSSRFFCLWPSPVRPCWAVCKSMNYRFMGLFPFYM